MTLHITLCIEYLIGPTRNIIVFLFTQVWRKIPASMGNFHTIFFENFRVAYFWDTLYAENIKWIGLKHTLLFTVISGWLWQEPVDVLCVWSTIRQVESDELFFFHKVVGQDHSGEVDEFIIFWCEISSGFCTPKIITKSVHFAELFKILEQGIFWRHSLYESWQPAAGGCVVRAIVSALTVRLSSELTSDVRH